MRVSVIDNDIDDIIHNSNIDFLRFSGKTILITGATGLIGYNLIMTLLKANQMIDNKIQIVALVRDREKAKNIYGDKSKEFCLIEGDIQEEVEIDQPIDYIIHTASKTASKSFVDEPVETIRVAVQGTINMLELAKKKKILGFVYTSSMEVYGSPDTDEKIDEKHSTNLNTMSVRTSYPESKRMCESLCCSYASQYHIPVKVIRLTQTFGPGVSYEDRRVFAEFARCVIEKRDIILHTKGETKRNYLYTSDAITAILTVLLEGKSGEAYNAANEDTYCTIYEMAQMVAHECANDEIKVKIQIEDESVFGFAPVLKMNLDTQKIKSLGWKPTVNLKDAYCKLIESLKIV